MPDKFLSLQDLFKLEMQQLVQERETTDPDPDLWRWSPLEITEFAHMLNVARQLAMDGLRKLTFIEAGSGIGTKLYLAQYHFGMSAIGYEISDDYIAKAAKLNVNTVKCDLRTDPVPWHEADIVYLSRPFKDDAAEVAWEQAVMDAMRPRRVLVSAYAAVKPYKWQCHYRAPFRGIWVKPSASSAIYDAMIRRTTAGSDPLVPEPSSANRR